MALELPTSLSPSKVSSFTDCALAFRYSAIDRLPEPPSLPATRGTLVHAALERLYVLEPHQRTLAAALTSVDEAFDVLRDLPDYTGLGLGPEQEARFLDDAEQLVRRYFELEDPTTIHPIGLELRLEVELDGLTLRGVIDRLELDADGGLVVTDYKTGRVPSLQHEQARLGGVHFYAFLCEQLFGRRPSRVQLLYLADPVVLTTEPTDQSIRGLERKLRAVWSAIERACTREDFRPRVSRLCTWCAFTDRCPAYAAAGTDAAPRVGDGATSVPVDPPLALRSAG
jgi:putative RecB family exonuclease